MLLVNGLTTLGLGALCTFLPDQVLSFLTQYEDVVVSWVATAALSVGGALCICQAVLFGAVFLVWIQATQAVANALTVAVLVYTALQWLVILFLCVAYHDYEFFPDWLLAAQIGGSAGFTFMNTLTIMWMFFARKETTRSTPSLTRKRRKPNDASNQITVTIEQQDTNHTGEGGATKADNSRRKTRSKKRRKQVGSTGPRELRSPLLDDDNTSDEDETHNDNENNTESKTNSDTEQKDEESNNEDEDDGLETKYGFGRLFALVKPHICWLISGCGALLFRLPFSLAQPHFVSSCIGSLIDEDYSGAT